MAPVQCISQADGCPGYLSRPAQPHVNREAKSKGYAVRRLIRTYPPLIGKSASRDPTPEDCSKRLQPGFERWTPRPQQVSLLHLAPMGSRVSAACTTAMLLIAQCRLADDSLCEGCRNLAGVRLSSAPRHRAAHVSVPCKDACCFGFS